jgi:predicted Zn-dependent peptidase
LKVLILIFFSLTIQSQSLFKEVAENVKKSIKKIELENGLRVIMLQNPTSPTLALYGKFKVGSVDETKDLAGTAHLLEHMLFKGTTNIGTKDFKSEKKFYILLKETGSELDKLKLKARNYSDLKQDIPSDLKKRISILERRLKSIENKQKEFIIPSEDTYIYEQHGQVGFNAYTSHDVTNYQIKLPSNRLEIWAKMESDRLKNPILREYYTERDVIMEERRMRIENRGMGILREKFLATAFSFHPYGQPVIGYDSNIPYLDIYDTEEFFKNHYAPNHMVIAIVGDQNFDETEKIIRKYFSDLKPSKKKSELSKVKEHLNKGEKRISFKYPGGSILMMGFNKPNFPHPDNSAFDIIDRLLSGGISSRLYKRLVIKEKLALSIDAWNSDPGERYSNLFTIYSQINSDTDIKKFEEIIWEEIDNLKQGKISEEELKIVKNKLTAEFLREIDSNATLADQLSYYELLTNNWEDLFNSYEKLETITLEDIQRVSKEYLTKENLTFGYLEGQIPSPKTKNLPTKK